MIIFANKASYVVVFVKFLSFFNVLGLVFFVKNCLGVVLGWQRIEMLSRIILTLMDILDACSCKIQFGFFQIIENSQNKQLTFYNLSGYCLLRIKLHL
jgi:hypothetical protein